MINFNPKFIIILTALLLAGLHALVADTNEALVCGTQYGEWGFGKPYAHTSYNVPNTFGSKKSTIHKKIQNRRADMTTTITIEGISHDNIEHLKQINSVVLPVRYNSNNPMFQHILQAGERFSHVAYMRHSPDTKPVPVGAVGCRLERVDTTNGARGDATCDRVRVYVMTIAVLAMYRRMGVGRAMMQRVMDHCELVNADPEAHGFAVESVYLNVQVNNDEALQFYKSFGFEVKQIVKNYYTRVEPRDAYLLVKELL